MRSKKDTEMRMKCVVCGRKFSDGKVVRIGPKRMGPFCVRCGKTVATEMRRLGLKVEKGGDTPVGVTLSDPFRLHNRQRGEIPFAARLSEQLLPHNPKALFLWDFPQEDFPEWYEMHLKEEGLTASDTHFTFDDYQTRLSAIKETLESKGIRVLFFKVTVREMMDACQKIGVPCNSQGRSQAIMMLAVSQLEPTDMKTGDEC
jgi:hypothetical protein